MANVDVPMGLKLLSSDSKITPYYVPATNTKAMFVGDPVVKVSAGSNTASITRVGAGSFPPGSLQSVVRPTTQDGPLTGVVVSVSYDPASSDLNYLPALTEGVVFVCDDPTAEFEVQEDSFGGALAATSAGLNVSLTVADGDVKSGMSGVELDSSTAVETATLEMRIKRIMNRPGNDIGNRCNWVVCINNHSEAAGSGTAGI